MLRKDYLNTIQEIYPGHFQIILDRATIAFLRHALSDNFKFVWVYSHKIRLDWKNYKLPLVDNTQLTSVIARDISFSFVLPTNEFKDIWTTLGAGITLAQINILPNYYLDPSRINGRTRYDLLKKECDYLFEIDIPAATDYGTIRSSNRDYLQSLIDDKEINWSDLP